MKRRHRDPRGAEAVQYTIRSVPKAVDRSLRRQAARLGKSLNEVAVSALARGAGVEAEARQHHDVDFLFGSWVEDHAVERSLAEQRAVDEDLWR